MLNWTAEDIEYLSNVMFKPYTEALAEQMDEHDDMSYEVCKKMILHPCGSNKSYSGRRRCAGGAWAVDFGST